MFPRHTLAPNLAEISLQSRHNLAIKLVLFSPLFSPLSTPLNIARKIVANARLVLVSSAPETVLVWYTRTRLFWVWRAILRELDADSLSVVISRGSHPRGVPLLAEADTCRKYVLPKLYASGWSGDHINEQRTFNFSVGRLMEFLTALRQDIGITVRCLAPDFLDTELSVFMRQLRVQGAAGEPEPA